MRALWAVLLLALPALSGCLSFLEEGDPDAGREVTPPRDVADPADYSVTGVKVHGKSTDDAITVESFDGTGLSAVVYEPQSPDALPDGSEPAFPVVVFVHGWGGMKEDWESVRFGLDAEPVNLLERFARAGFVTVAYDVRGYGRSDGEVTVAGPAEMRDLDAVLSYARDRFRTTGYAGVTGLSYGGGHALNAWAHNPNVTTAVPHQGWTDLYGALLPGDVPKIEWGVALAGVGTAGSAYPGTGGGTGNLHPMVAQWLQDAALRQDLAAMEAQMDARSVGGVLSRVQKPLLLCQGLQESLFPQFHEALLTAGGFTRAYVHTGGHGTHDEACWDRTLDWFQFFLRGLENGVDRWPLLETVDADPDRPALAFDRDDLTDARDGAERSFLRFDHLVAYESDATFTIQQRALNNPLSEPSVLWDQAGMAYNAVPHQARFEGDDPTAVFFAGKPVDGSTVVLGAPRLVLRLADPDATADFQVAASLFHVIAGEGGESSRILSRGAHAYVNGTTAEHGGTLEIPMDWTKATLESGDRLALKLSANEVGYYLPLQANYAIDFTGRSYLDVPYFG